MKLDLDTKFFTGKGDLKPEVRKVLLSVASDVFDDMDEEYGLHLIPDFVVLTGSLLSENWDEASDVDFHIGVDYSKLYPGAVNFLKFYAKDFNHNEYGLMGRKLELYFQDAKEPHETPGIYDVLNGVWIKHPYGEKVDLTDEMQKGADQQKKFIEHLREDYEALPKIRTSILEYQEMVQEFWQSLRSMRQMSLEQDGIAGFGNWVWKLMRRNGALEMLVELLRQIQDDYYDVWPEQEAV